MRPLRWPTVKFSTRGVPDLAAVGVTRSSTLRGTQVSAQEALRVPVGNEADVVGVGLLGHAQAETLGPSAPAGGASPSGRTTR